LRFIFKAFPFVSLGVEVSFRRISMASLERCTPSMAAEDVGGPSGYMDYLEALRDPSHPEHREMVEWRGPSFNPERFDLASIDRRLPQLSRSRRKGYGNIANKPVKL